VLPFEMAAECADASGRQSFGNRSRAGNVAASNAHNDGQRAGIGLTRIGRVRRFRSIVGPPTRCSSVSRAKTLRPHVLPDIVLATPRATWL
jgi:hypothetical protein